MGISNQIILQAWYEKTVFPLRSHSKGILMKMALKDLTVTHIQTNIKIQLALILSKRYVSKKTFPSFVPPFNWLKGEFDDLIFLLPSFSPLPFFSFSDIRIIEVLGRERCGYGIIRYYLRKPSFSLFCFARSFHIVSVFYCELEKEGGQFGTIVFVTCPL